MAQPSAHTPRPAPITASASGLTVNPRDFNAAGDVRFALDPVIDAGSNTLRAKSAPFAIPDPSNPPSQKSIVIYGAGPRVPAQNDSTAFFILPLFTTITTFVSRSEVILADKAQNSVPGPGLRTVVWGKTSTIGDSALDGTLSTLIVQDTTTFRTDDVGKWIAISGAGGFLNGIRQFHFTTIQHVHINLPQMNTGNRSSGGEQ